VVARWSCPRSRCNAGNKIPFLHGRDAEGVAQDVRRNLAADLRTIRDHAHDALKGPYAQTEGVVEGEVAFEERLLAIQQLICGRLFYFVNDQDVSGRLGRVQLQTGVTLMMFRTPAPNQVTS
jgi:hypothetical protein